MNIFTVIFTRDDDSKYMINIQAETRAAARRLARIYAECETDSVFITPRPSIGFGCGRDDRPELNQDRIYSELGLLI